MYVYMYSDKVFFLLILIYKLVLHIFKIYLYIYTCKAVTYNGTDSCSMQGSSKRRGLQDGRNEGPVRNSNFCDPRIFNQVLYLYWALELVSATESVGLSAPL